MKHQLRIKNLAQLRWLPQPLAEFTREGEGLPCLLRSVSEHRKVRMSKFELNIELCLQPRFADREIRQQSKPFSELRHRFAHCAPLNRLLARFQPIIHCLLVEPGLSAMVCQDFWLCRGN